MTPHVDRSLRLRESEYFPDPQGKTGIALHHTVCDSARTTLDIWRRDRAADGTPRRVAFEQRFVGIEITSEGGLTECDGRLYAYDRKTPACERPAATALECPALYRGYRWFDRYEPAQLTALGHLVDELCARFAIPRLYPDRPYLYYGEKLRSFEGVIGHAMVRADKSDPAPNPELWKTLEHLAHLKPVPVAPAAPVAPVPPVPPVAPVPPVDASFDANARRHVTRLARALGFAKVTERRLEVHHA